MSAINNVKTGARGFLDSMRGLFNGSSFAGGGYIKRSDWENPSNVGSSTGAEWIIRKSMNADVALKESGEFGSGAARMGAGNQAFLASLGQDAKDIKFGDLRKIVEERFGKEKNHLNILRTYTKASGFKSKDIFDVAEDGTLSLKNNVDDITAKYGMISHFRMGLMDHARGDYSMRKIGTTAAAGFMGVSAAGRILSGGGLYKDSEGNTNIIGIPGI